MKERVVLAYSGGLDTSVAIKYFQEKYNMDVITVTVNIGQVEDLNEIAERAKALGAIKHYSIDALREFTVDYIFPAIKANALYGGKYPLGTALGRPLIAKKLVEVAEKEGATTVAHGCTGKGNDQVRFDITIKALNPNLKIIAPVRDWNLSRDEEIEYVKKHNIPLEIKRSIYSVDQNLWGRSIESGPLEDPYHEPSHEVFQWTKPLDKTPDRPEYLELEFKEGVPIAVNGQKMDPVSLIQYVNKVAGEHGIGVIDHIEDRVVGIKSREVYEYPAATCIIEAHKDLEKLVLTRHQLAFKSFVEQEWAWLVYSGLWMEPLRMDLQAFIDSTQKFVEGKVRLKMYKGSVRVVGRSSPYSLYSYALATYDSSSTFDQRASIGFIHLWGLQSHIANLIRKKKVEDSEIYGRGSTEGREA
ncbi:MAG: argininosuccinate synthase [Nitrososphaerota archaeon]|nr:argininosuccinate synthase [Nitrososphaerota archaeon]